MPVASERLVRRVWVRFRRTNARELRDFLIRHYLPIVQEHARRMRSRLPASVSVDELASAGALGLMDAIDTFDPSRDVKFETYCTRRVCGAILDELRSMDLMSRLLRQRARQLAGLTQSLWTELGRMPSEEEIAGKLQMPAGKFGRYVRGARSPVVHSLSNPLAEEEHELSHLRLIADDRAADPTRELQRHTLRELVSRGLPRDERLIVLLYYYEGLTMGEVGQALGLSESRVCQKHKSIVKRLKSRLAGRAGDFEIAAA